MSYGVGRLGNAAGPLLVAYLFSHYGYTSVFVYIAVCWAGVTILITAFGPRTQGTSVAVCTAIVSAANTRPFHGLSRVAS